MTPLLVADESVDYLIVATLREAGFLVMAVVEDFPGWPDTEVLQYAYEQEAFLITEDKDFGELTYRLRKPSHGILLVRLMEERSERKANKVLSLFQDNFDRLWHSFSVLEKAKLRVRPIRF